MKDRMTGLRVSRSVWPAANRIWTCHGLMPLRLLIYAAFLSKAKGLSQPSAECLRRGL